MSPHAPPNPEKWLDEYGDYLYRYAVARLNDHNLAEDMVQETLLSALKAYAKFDGRSSEKTWLVTILKNKIIDQYRKASRRDVKVESDIPSEDQSQDFLENGHCNMDRAPSDWGENPEKALEQKEFFAILQQCLKRLPRKIAQIFSMRQFDGIDSKQICKDMNITSSNLWVILHRARAQLRRCLDQNWFGAVLKKEV